MNKQIILNFVVTMIIAVILSLTLPWWSVMVAGFVSALFFNLKRAATFVVPFLAIFCFWAIYAFIISSANDFTLAKKIAILLPLGGNPYALILVTGLVGGFAAGVAAIFGNMLGSLVRK
ncbi:hypothetical protein WNY78_13315 [Psychroserpens sp. AS72]|uniref:hypothetical protein n=1 Tax=Psychroserpens sp. AS72 TaxID=3135775 RepID=UPI003173C6D1